MKNFKFILLCTTIAVMTTGLVGCKKGVYDEKQALDAQQSLLEYKYAQETNLEKLRQSGASALEQLKYQFSINTLKFSDSLSDANSRKRDIVIVVKDIITSKVVSGATVSIPTLAGTVLTATTDSLGFAYFPASRNGNVPNPASAMVSKTGYASGTSYNSITGTSSVVSSGSSAGQTTMYLLSSAATNTVKGKVYIETDLTNNAAESAANRLVTIYTNYAPGGSQLSQRFEWSALTDADGNYSIKVPDLTGTLYFAHSAIDTTVKMFVNGIVPGLDSVPTVKSIPATFYLSYTSISNGNLTTQTSSNLILNVQRSSFYTVNPDNTNASGGAYTYQIPQTVSRYSMTAVADSNGRGHFFGLPTPSIYSLTSNATLDSVNIAATNFPLGSLTSVSSLYDNNNTTVNYYASRYLAGTTTADTITAVVNDVMSNSDGYWKTYPTMKFVRTQTTDGLGKFKYISRVYQDAGGLINKAVTSATTTATNWVKTYSQTRSTDYNIRDVVSSSIYNLSGTTVSGGKTTVVDLTFGVGKLKQIVR